MGLLQREVREQKWQREPGQESRASLLTNR